MQVNDTQKQHWERKFSVEQVESFTHALPEGISQRAFAKEHEIPRTTLQHWLKRRNSIDTSKTLVDFFESTEGLAFLHRLVIALHFVMSLICGNGLRPIAKVLELAGLDAFVANSLGSRQGLNAAMQEQVIAFDQVERERLGKQMKPKRITICEDETFHPQICLVAIEAVSNFILLEEYAESRDAATWTAAMKKTLKGMPVEILQSTSDEGKGLLSHVQNGLGSRHSPDLFHVQQDLSRATSIALAGQVRTAEKSLNKETLQLEALIKAQQVWAQTSHGPGRPPSFRTRIAEAKQLRDLAEQDLQSARERKERARQAIRGIGKCYHPFDLTTGAKRTAAQLTTELTQRFTEIKAIATEASLPERCFKLIEKAYRLIPVMANTLAFFHSEVHKQIAALELTPQQTEAVSKGLLPAAYIGRAACKAKHADDRVPLNKLSENMRAEADLDLTGLPINLRAVVDATVQECVDIFQRSSSCVEGRNGHLALYHHSLHSLGSGRLQALTTVHNFFIQRPDGTTAAERFFGFGHKNMFDWLLDHLDMPARPAKKRKVKATSPPTLH